MSVAVTRKEQSTDGIVTVKTTLYKVTSDIAKSTLSLATENVDVLDTFEMLISSDQAFKEVSDLLLVFANNSLNILKSNVISLEKITTAQLILLVCLLAGFFVPLNHWFIAPKTAEEHVCGH